MTQAEFKNFPSHTSQTKRTPNFSPNTLLPLVPHCVNQNYVLLEATNSTILMKTNERATLNKSKAKESNL